MSFKGDNCFLLLYDKPKGPVSGKVNVYVGIHILYALWAKSKVLLDGLSDSIANKWLDQMDICTKKTMHTK